MLSEAEIDAISPIAQVRRGRYRVPTFSIHGDCGEIVPCDISATFHQALEENNVESRNLCC